MKVSTQHNNGAEEFVAQDIDVKLGVDYLHWDGPGSSLPPQLYVEILYEDVEFGGASHYIDLHAAQALRDFLVRVLPK